MSVLLIMDVVSTTVITLLVHITAPAILDINYTTGANVEVCSKNYLRKYTHRFYVFMYYSSLFLDKMNIYSPNYVYVHTYECIYATLTFMFYEFISIFQLHRTNVKVIRWPFVLVCHCCVSGHLLHFECQHKTNHNF